MPRPILIADYPATPGVNARKVYVYVPTTDVSAREVQKAIDEGKRALADDTFAPPVFEGGSFEGDVEARERVIEEVKVAREAARNVAKAEQEFIEKGGIVYGD